MKIKALLATLIGAVALQGATAGEWCPPAPDKCPVECCDDTKGSVSFGYDTDYLFYGIRVARDNVWADVSYTFDSLPLPLTLSVWHLSSLGSGGPLADGYGDETDFTASVAFPSFCGVDASFGYRNMIYSTTRLPNTPGRQGAGGDMQNELFIDLSKEIACGFTLNYRGAYDFNIRDFDAENVPNSDLSGAWMHIASLGKTVDLTDCLAIDLTAGVFYSDNYWQANTYGRSTGDTRDSGWQNYFIQAALPIALSGCATLTPYIGYSGTPDGWIGDGLEGINPASPAAGNTGANANDLFHGGVSINVGF